MCLGSERRVQGDEIGRGKRSSSSSTNSTCKRARTRGGEIRIVRQHAHAEGNGAPAEFAADAAHADDA